MQQLLALEPRPDGVVCYNDPVAAGALKAALEAGFVCLRRRRRRGRECPLLRPLRVRYLPSIRTALRSEKRRRISCWRSSARRAAETAQYSYRAKGYGARELPPDGRGESRGCLAELRQPLC